MTPTCDEGNSAAPRTGRFPRLSAVITTTSGTFATASARLAPALVLIGMFVPSTVEFAQGSFRFSATTAVVGTCGCLVIIALTRSPALRWCAAAGLLLAATLVIFSMTPLTSSWDPTTRNANGPTLPYAISTVALAVLAIAFSFAGITVIVSKVTSIVELTAGQSHWGRRCSLLLNAAAYFSIFVATGRDVFQLIAMARGQGSYSRGYGSYATFSTGADPWCDPSPYSAIKAPPGACHWWNKPATLADTAGETFTLTSPSMLLSWLPLVAVAMTLSILITHFDRSTERPAWRGSSSFRRASRHIRRRLRTEHRSRFPTISILALLLTLAAPWSESGSIVLVLQLPLWLAQFFVIKAILKRITCGSRRSWPLPSAHRESVLLLHALRGDSSSSLTSLSTRRLLALGPRGSLKPNAELAASLAALLSIPAVLYLVWATASVGRLEAFGETLFYGVSALLAEGTRWIVTGFVFGYLYPRLPGSAGPEKALALIATWLAGAAVSVTIGRLFGGEVVNTGVIFRSAEFAVILTSVAIAYDYRTIRAAGGNYRDLRMIYTRHNYLQTIAVATPIVLSIITLIGQISSGAGLEIANTVVSGVNDALHAH